MSEQSFGIKLRELRGKRPRREVAAKADISLQSLLKLEKGQHTDPRLSSVVGLAYALDVDIGQLLAPLVATHKERVERPPTKSRRRKAA